jgi:predicted metal-dependent peptidase
MLQPVEASKWCETIATDGKNLYYNREFIKGLTPKELDFMICHELMHLVYDHMGRTGWRDKKMFDMANDYIVNYTLVKDKIGDMPKGGLFDEKYTDEMSSEEVYRLLEQNSVKVKMTLDMHLDGMGSEDSDGEGGGKEVTVTVHGSSDGPPKLTEQDLQDIRNSVRSAVINAARTCDPGSIPGSVKSLIDSFTDPKISWKDLLTDFVQSTVKDDYTFNRPSKRSFSSLEMTDVPPIILPSQSNGTEIKIAGLIDSSGSMSIEMLRELCSELIAICDQYVSYTIFFAFVDTKVHWPFVITPQTKDQFLEELAVHGQGGTSLAEGFRWLSDPYGSAYGGPPVDGIDGSPIEVDRVVFFTDMYTNTWGDEPDLPTPPPTLWIAHSNHDPNVTAPHGMVVRYESFKDK